MGNDAGYENVSPSAARHRRRRRAGLLLGLGSLPLLSCNEARRAIPASTMFVSGDWLLPR